MKKYLNLSAFYLALGLISGVFFREFTKENKVVAFFATTLFLLKVIMFLINIIKNKTVHSFIKAL
ncbi:MAG: DUF2871 family protein [Clostridium sp.]